MAYELLVKPKEEHKELVHIKPMGKLQLMAPDEFESDYNSEETGRFPVKLKFELKPDPNYLEAIQKVLKQQITIHGQ